MTDNKYEEAEIVSNKKTSSNNFFEDDFSRAQYRAMKRQILGLSFWSLFASILGFIVVFALLVSILFWVLPFVVAAFLIALFVLILARGVAFLVNIFKK